MGVTLIDTEELERELRKRVYAEVAATLNDRADMYERDSARAWPCEIAELRMLANAYRTYAEGVGVASMETLRKRRDKYRDILQEALESYDRTYTDWWPDWVDKAREVLKPRKGNDAEDSP